MSDGRSQSNGASSWSKTFRERPGLERYARTDLQTTKRCFAQCEAAQWLHSRCQPWKTLSPSCSNLRGDRAGGLPTPGHASIPHAEDECSDTCPQEPCRDPLIVSGGAGQRTRWGSSRTPWDDDTSRKRLLAAIPYMACFRQDGSVGGFSISQALKDWKPRAPARSRKAQPLVVWQATANETAS